MLLVSSCVPVITWLCSRMMRFQSRPIDRPLLTIESPVAQWLEHPSRSRRVAGSYPIWGSEFFRVEIKHAKNEASQHLTNLCFLFLYWKEFSRGKDNLTNFYFVSRFKLICYKSFELIDRRIDLLHLSIDKSYTLRRRSSQCNIKVKLGRLNFDVGRRNLGCGDVTWGDKAMGRHTPRLSR